MPAIILESSFGSEYDDSPSSYEFPERYRSLFEPLDRGIPMFAVIYEPRGERAGRMAYVGLATISRPPTATGGRSGNGQRLWRVEYDAPARPFETPVPREPFGEPVETLLRVLPRGRSRNVATFGRAVRALPDADLQRIVELGNVGVLDTIYPTLDEHMTPDVLVAERSRRLVEAIEREAGFRDRVLAAYDYRCAVSGLGLGRVSRTKSQGLLDAAHIRPVARSGSDAVSNGLPLTPTLHRLFDAGLFTVHYDEGRPKLRTSPRLEPGMIQAPERGFVLAVRDGLPLIVPPDQRLWPNAEQLGYHAREIFKGQ